MPDFRSAILERLAPLHLDPAQESLLAEELAQHLEDRFRELLAGGLPPDEAQRRALAELEDPGPLRTAVRAAPRPPSYALASPAPRRDNVLGELARDARHAIRTFAHAPLFVFTVVLTLGFGIGANSAVFTLLDTLLLNPLPVPDPAALTAVSTLRGAKSGPAAPLPVSYADLADIQTRSQVFSSVAGYTSVRPVTLQTGRGSERLFAEFVTGNYFSTLGLRPALGRFFLPEETTTAGSSAAAVISYSCWQSRFAAAPDIVGRVLELNRVRFTVIGVAPPRFIGVNAIFGPNLWLPATMAERTLPDEMRNVLTDRAKAVFLGVARRSPGASLAQAQANLGTLSSALAREYPDTNSGHTFSAQPITAALFGSAGAGTEPFVFAGAGLLLAVAIVLLIACSNIANLLLARASARRREVAIRLALGASRARLVRQLLTESVLLGLLSGVAGLAIGYAGLELLWSFRPAEVASNFNTPALDFAVLVFTFAVSLLTGLLFGSLPALQSSRIDVAEFLKEESHSAGRARARVTLSNLLLVSQVAFSFLLLITGGLFLRSIARAANINPGFDVRHLAVLLTNPGQAGYTKPRTLAFYDDVRARVAALPGVVAVSWASNLPLWGRLTSGLKAEGYIPQTKSDSLTAILNTVSIDYFETAGIPVAEGREFLSTDREDSGPVAIVNEKLAHDLWPGQNPLGKRIQLPGENFWRRVTGVARNANYSSLAEPPQFCVYVPLAQNYSDGMTLYVRTAGDPSPLLASLQREVRAAGPEIMATDVRTGATIVGQALFSARMAVGLLTLFGLVALTLACIGLYGLMSYSVNQRRREIGVRMALGARRANVLSLVLRQGMSLVAAGLILGFAANLLCGRLLERLLYGVSPADPLSFAAAAGVLLLIAFCACYLPARRASRLDPLAALREG